MPRGGRRIKLEPSTIRLDYPTPGNSIRSNTTVTPKQETPQIFDLISDDETPSTSFKTQATEDEGYSSRMVDQVDGRRSISVDNSTPAPHLTFPNRRLISSMALAKPQGLEFVGSKVKILVDAISDLRRYGLQHVVELPELVLVGDQSAGKSSLMSALTEVKLPRDQGICTKCPANIKTSPANKWSCKISLVQEYKYSPIGRIISESTVNRKNPFPPWVEQTSVEKEFMTTEDKDQLEEGIKWAQLALLNHDTDYRDFIPGTGLRALGDFQHERDIAEAKFSPNLISVEISGPGLSSLSFFDLPGVFRSAPDRKDQYLVKVIENLAKKYIGRENALIIWTLAMKTDPSNSETGNIIRECNATHRTIGVLTNPDHVASRHAEYEKVLRGLSHVVDHGYFVTKQPGENSTLEGPNYHAEARDDEERYFNTSKLWREEWVEFRHRCGTTVIQKYLSQQLAKQIQASIPRLEEQIDQRKREVEDKLRACPAPPAHDVRNVIMRLLSEFTHDVRYIMDGDSLDMTTTFQSDWTNLSNQFRDLILHIKPTVTVSHPSDHISQDVIELSSDNDDDEPAIPRNRKRAAPDEDQLQVPRRNIRAGSAVSSPRTPQNQNRYHSPEASNPKRESGQMNPPPVPSPQFRRSRSADNPFWDTPFANYAHLGKKFTNLDEIRNAIANHLRPGLPGLFSIKTHNEFCLMAVESWRAPLDVFLTQIFSKVRKQLQLILHKHLGKYEQTELFRTAKKQLDKFIDVHIMGQRVLANDIFEMERYKSFTVNRAAMNDIEAKEYQKLKTARRNSQAKAYVLFEQRFDPKKKFPLDLQPEEKNRLMQKRINEVKDEKLAKDDFDLELRVASYVRAYYLVAGMRFVDNICVSVYCKFFRDIRESIFMHLEEKLDIDKASDGDEVCRKLMEEDDTIGKERYDLQQEMEKLSGFTKRLEDLVREINEPEPFVNVELDNNFNPESSQLSSVDSTTANGGSSRDAVADDTPMDDF